MKYMDGSLLTNIVSVVIIKIQKNNLNRLLFFLASAFSSSSSKTITSRHLPMLVP